MMNAIHFEILRVLCSEPTSNPDGWFGGREVAALMKPRLEITGIFNAAVKQMCLGGYVQGETDQVPDWNRFLRSTILGFETYSKWVESFNQPAQHSRNDGDPVENVTPPRKWLIGKAAILEALDQPDEKWSWILTLSKDFDGPIQTREGGASIVMRAKLFAWFEKALEQYGRHESREDEKKSTVSDNYNYGKNQTAVPQINGSVKKRKRKAGE